MLRSSASDVERQWSADVILRQTNQLRHMVDDLLDVSRITRGTIELRREPIDLATIITRALESVRSPLTEKATRVTVSLSPQPLVLMADPTRMEQVFVNLFGNAIKFTEERGHMEVTAYADADKTIVISVKDDGIGIDTSTLPQVFELFTQGRQATDRSVGGLGIGLTMVKRLVEMHGGEVTATSEGPGAGSEFTIRLPGSGEPLAEASAPKRTLSPEEMHRLRVLVVDDNQDTATGMAKLLSAAGHSVTTVYDGPSALEAARRERPDVMLLDIGLPGMSGYTVAAELRKEEQFKNTKIIALSGYGQAHDRRRSLEAGFDHHLVKPVDKDEVLELLARQLPLEPDQAEPSS